MNRRYMHVLDSKLEVLYFGSTGKMWGSWFRHWKTWSLIIPENLEIPVILN